MKGDAEDYEERLEIDEIFLCGAMTLGIAISASAAIAALMQGKLEVFAVYAVAALGASAVFAAGWYYQRLASAALVVATVALAAWGIIAGWDVGVWLIVGGVVMLPVLAVAGMYLFADHEEEEIEHANTTTPGRAIHA